MQATRDGPPTARFSNVAAQHHIPKAVYIGQLSFALGAQTLIATYTMKLRLADRILVLIVFPIFVLCGAFMFYRSAVQGDIGEMGFTVIWLAFVAWTFWGVFSGPVEIQVLTDSRVRFRSWFRVENETLMSEIRELELIGNILWITTVTRKYTTLSGFNGLSEFIHEIAASNEKLVVKGM
ncbi:MAG: hypothetical protein ACI915_000041 [Gammaproteobacteria bacterium]